MRTTDEKHAVCDLGVAVHDVGEMSLLIKRLRGLKGVVSVDRAA
jgi:hypothetical protein